MDEKKENSNDNQDIVVGDDGSMNLGTSIDVKTESGSNDEPVVNDLQAPPATESISKEDETDVESAVSFITGENNDNEDNNEAEVTEETSSNDVEPENATEVKEQEITTSEPTPEVSEPINSQFDSSDSFESPPETPTSVAPDVVTTTSSSSMSNNEQSQPHPHRNNKKLAIIITLVVALIMAGAAIYVFVSAQDNAEESTQLDITSIPEQSETPVEPATGDDVNQTINEIDQTLQSIDETDLGEDTISDDTLGL